MRRLLHRRRVRSFALRTTIDTKSDHFFQIATYFMTHDSVLVYDTCTQ